MRTATIVLVGYLLMLVLGAVWRYLPLGALADATPDVAAVIAAYLGLTARRHIAPAVGGAVTVGYLCDLLTGAPPGLFALVSGMVAIIGHLMHRRILVRGLWMTFGFVGVTAFLAELLVILTRVFWQVPRAGLGTELVFALEVAVATALIGPLLLGWLRRVDAAFARTHREREHALEGIAS